MQELRLAFRALRVNSIVSGAAIVSLALGIGANSAIFSLVDSLLLRSLPVRNPEQLVMISDGAASGVRPWSYPVWDQVRQQTQFFDGALAWFSTRLDSASGGEAQFVETVWASGSFLDTLGVQPLLGRTLSDADDRPGGGPDGPVVVISYDFWRRRFGGVPDVIGRMLTLERVPFRIVGVTPRTFFGVEVGRRFDVVMPLADVPMLPERGTILDRRTAAWLTIMGRLKPGQTVERASAALRGVQPQIREATMPDNRPRRELDRYMKEAFTVVPAATGNSSLRVRYGRPLVMFMVVVALLLLIACVNVANLLLARAFARRHELSLRLALGSPRSRLVRGLLTESVVLAAAGASLGVLIASWGSQLLVRQLSTPNNPVFLDLQIEWRIVAFTMGITVSTALLFGTAPAFWASALKPIDALKSRDRATGGNARISLASAFVVIQVALSVVLVVAAGLFLRSFSSLATRDLGFDRERLLIVSLDTQRSAPGQRVPFFERARDAVRSLPGVADVAVSAMTPVSGTSIGNLVEVPNGPVMPDSERVVVVNVVSPGWFRTYHTPVLAGRDFTDRDQKDAPAVAVVNQAFARKFVNGTQPVGQTIVLGRRRRPLEVVGVVGDAVYRSLRDPMPPTMYLSLAQYDNDPPGLFVEGSLSIRSRNAAPLSLSRSVAAAIADMGPAVPLTFRSLDEQVSISLVQERLLAMLSVFLGALALLLGGVGLYGVTAFTVGRRRTEIGIRLALGAAPAGVVKLILLRVLAVIATGLVAGIAVSLWASKFISSLLFGITPHDPATVIGGTAILVVVGMLAGWLPARRASQNDPAAVLRES